MGIISMCGSGRLVMKGFENQSMDFAFDPGCNREPLEWSFY